MAKTKPVTNDELEASLAGFCQLANEAGEFALRLSNSVDRRPLVTSDHVQGLTAAMRDLNDLRDVITTFYVGQCREAELEARLKGAGEAA